MDFGGLVLSGGFGSVGDGWGDLLLMGVGGRGRLRWLAGVGHFGEWGGRRGGVDVVWTKV